MTSECIVHDTLSGNFIMQIQKLQQKYVKLVEKILGVKTLSFMLP